MPIQDEWTKCLADAKKLLGNGATVDTRKMAPLFKAVQEFGAALPPFDHARDALSKSVLNLETISGKFLSLVKQAGDDIVDDDYNLDASKPDDKKKIEAASKQFKAFFDRWSKVIGDYDGTLDELVKHSEHFTKFKTVKI